MDRSEPVMTRGGAMPKTRGGNGEEKRRRKDEERRIKQELAAKSAQADFLRAKVTREELHKQTDQLYRAVVEMNEKLSLIGIRVESIIKVIEEEYPGHTERVDRHVGKLLEWREAVRSINHAPDQTFSSLVAAVRAWNAQEGVDPITVYNLSLPRLTKAFVDEHGPSKAERIAALNDLGCAPELQEKLLALYEKHVTPAETLVEPSSTDVRVS